MVTICVISDQEWAQYYSWPSYVGLKFRWWTKSRGLAVVFGFTAVGS